MNVCFIGKGAVNYTFYLAYFLTHKYCLLKSTFLEFSKPFHDVYSIYASKN